MTIETPPQTPKLVNIQSLRGIAALLVVVSHLFVIEQKYSPDQILGKWSEMGLIGVDLFFVISGFIMVNVAWTFRRGWPAVTEFMFARVTRIYPLYWLISLAVLAIWIWHPEFVFSSFGNNDPNLLKSFALWPDTRAPLLVIGWTLIHEMFFYSIFAFALLLNLRWLLAFLLLWAAALSIGILVKLPELSTLLAIIFSPLSFEFLCGALAAWVFKTYAAPYANTALIFGLLSLSAALIYTFIQHSGVPYDFMHRAIYFAVPLTLIVYGLSAIETHGFQMPACTSKLGNWSYSLYLTHILSLSLFGRIWGYFAQLGVWDNVVALCLMPLLAILVSALCWKLAEAPMLHMAKQMRKKLFT